MENTARKLTFENTFTTIKEKLDVSFANPSVMMTVSEKAITIIADWERKKINATPEQRNIYNIEILKLEALIQRMTDLTLDCYDVQASAYVDAKGLDKPVDTVIDTIIDVAAKADEPVKEDAKTVLIFDGKEEVKTPKLSDLAQACKQLLKKGNFDSAELLASKYLTVGDYIPKKEKQKARKFSEKEVASWLRDLNSNLAEEKHTAKETKPVEDKPKEVENNAAAKGLTTQQVEQLRLLNNILTSSIAGHQDPQSRGEVLKQYLVRSEDVKTETDMLNEYALRVYNAFHGPKISESDLSLLCKDLEAFNKVFFAHRGYTEESVKEWSKHVREELEPDHFKFLKAKNGVVLFPVKEVVATIEKIDPDLKRAKLIPEDKVDVTQVRSLLATIYKNGGLIEDVKSNPDILGLMGKDIHINDKNPALKFGNESTLFPWIEVLYKEVANKVGPLKKATDEEVANESAKCQDKSEVKVENKKVEEEKKNIKKKEGEKVVIGPKQMKAGDKDPSIANLDDFMLLIETAAKNDVSVEDFLKEHSPLVTNENGSIKKLMSTGENKASSSVILAGKADLETWVTEVYKRFAKSDNPINTAEEIKDESLVSSFRELTTKGRELLAKGTPVDQFMAWLSKNLLNRKMKEQKPGGEFKDPKAVAAFAKGSFKIEAKKEDVKAAEVKSEVKEQVGESAKVAAADNYTAEDIAEIIANDSKDKDVKVIHLARSLRDMYVSAGIQVSDRVPTIADALRITEEIIKDSNPELYAERKKEKEQKAAASKDQGVLALDEKKTEDKIETAEHPIFEKVDLKSQDAELYEKTISLITTMDALFNMATEYNEAGKYNEGLSLCLDRMPLIEESKNWNTEQITAWYDTNILNKGPVVDAKEVAETTEIVDTPHAEEGFQTLMNAKSPKHFKRAIGAILKSNEDNKELRDKIIEAIKNGKGSHTRMVAKMPETEMHKQITNIKGKVAGADKPETEE